MWRLIARKSKTDNRPVTLVTLVTDDRIAGMSENANYSSNDASHETEVRRIYMPKITLYMGFYMFYAGFTSKP